MATPGGSIRDDFATWRRWVERRLSDLATAASTSGVVDGGGVLSVNGDTGPDVVLDAADVGAATTAYADSGDATTLAAAEAYTDEHAGGDPVWGGIGGTMSDQTDLQSALDGKQDVDAAAGGDLTGNYPSPAIAAGVVTDTEVAAANLDGAAATPSMRTLGTSSTQACAGDDARLSDARTPLAHASSHSSLGSDPIAPSSIGAAPATTGTSVLKGDGAGGTTAAGIADLGIARGVATATTNASGRLQIAHGMTGTPTVWIATDANTSSGTVPVHCAPNNSNGTNISWICKKPDGSVLASTSVTVHWIAIL